MLLKKSFKKQLYGLWRANFFEKVAFYGSSALRILYGLNRFSEDLDFSLLSKEKNFNLTPFNNAIIKELKGFGFEATMDTKIKNFDSNIESAFIKADSKKQLIIIDALHNIITSTHKMQIIKIKMEVDTNPPRSFDTETKFLFQPIPFSIKSLTLPDLFAGKIHTLLCRAWTIRVKGHDWYDFVWYLSNNIPVNLQHLKARLIQSNAWDKQLHFNKIELINLLAQKITITDFAKANEDISLFIKNTESMAVWSKEFFIAILATLQTIN